jgi:hypothetical protein
MRDGKEIAAQARWPVKKGTGLALLFLTEADGIPGSFAGRLRSQWPKRILSKTALAEPTFRHHRV